MVHNDQSDSRNASLVDNSTTSRDELDNVDSRFSDPSSAQANYSHNEPALSARADAGHKGRLASGAELSGARYRIERLVAAGGMGAVYRALDTRFNRPCAVKEMLDEFQSEQDRAQAIEWFSREATLLLDLNHPCIPRVRDFFAERGKHYLVMDFIEGRTMAEVVERDGQVVGLEGARGVSETRARSWAQQLCDVLGYLHRQSPPIIFRDLKPNNIMVTERDEIKLIDFGIARTFHSQRQATIIMTLGYAPPEQLHGMPEPRSDLYALGATLHKALTRHDAVNNKPTIFSFPPIRVLRPDISPAFEQVVMKALAPVKEQRWSSAVEMERALFALPPISGNAPLTPSLPSIRPGQQALYPKTPHASSPISSEAKPVVRPSASGMTGPAGVHIQTALGYLNAGRIEAAHAAVHQAYALEPQNALVHKLYGQIFARRQPPQADMAIQAYDYSLRLNPDDAETHKLVGDVFLFLRQQAAQAIPAYTQSLRLNAADFEVHQRLAQCFEKVTPPDLAAALREYQEAARLAPRSPALYFALGQLAMRLKQFPIAEHAFVQVLTINPADHQTRFLLSQVYENEGKLEDALRECTYVLQPLRASNPGVQQMYQRLRARLGR